MFYTVLAKALVVGVRTVIRRSVGLVALLMDAILNEAAASLEANLILPPHTGSSPDHLSPLNPMHAPVPRTAYDLFWHALFTVFGVLIGHRLPRAARLDRNQPPTRLRVV